MIGPLRTCVRWEMSGATEELSGPPAPKREHDLWIEVLAPVEVAGVRSGNALQGLLTPADVMIAMTPYGSILLNQSAWTLLHETLKAVEGLQTRHVAASPTRPCYQPFSLSDLDVSRRTQ